MHRTNFGIHGGATNKPAPAICFRAEPSCRCISNLRDRLRNIEYQATGQYLGLERTAPEALYLTTNGAVLTLHTRIHIHHGDNAGCDDRAILPPLCRKQTNLYADSVTE